MTDPVDESRDETPDPQGSTGGALVVTVVVLLALTLTSWAISHVALGSASTPVALAIAGIKAGCVVYWFMELPLASLPARVVAVVTITFIALLCAGTVADIALR